MNGLFFKTSQINQSFGVILSTVPDPIVFVPHMVAVRKSLMLHRIVYVKNSMRAAMKINHAFEMTDHLSGHILIKMELLLWAHEDGARPPL